MSGEFIDRLVAGSRPARRSAVPARLALFLAAGAIAAMAIMIPWIGLRPDLAAAAAGDTVFWVKFGYTLALTLGGFWAVERLSRPGGSGRLPGLVILGVFVSCGVLGIAQLAMAPPTETRTLLVGGTALVCPFYIVALSTPVFIATIAAMRRLAPTNLPLAGLAAGLLSGSAGAWVYAFHCGENGLPFLAIWYTLGVAVVAAIGAITGRWLLRW